MQTEQLLPVSLLNDAADCLRLLGHPMRLRMIDILARGPLPVHEIADLCELPPHQTCEHLRLLRGHGLLGSRRNGRAVLYRIVDPRLPRLLNCIRTACDIPNQGDIGKTELDSKETEK